MGVDSNSRSTVWNDKITNPRGKKLEEFVCVITCMLSTKKTKEQLFKAPEGKVI